ncbi:Fc.00g009120.m01.CDS01 [Cosmosporella sp. VM-42]
MLLYTRLAPPKVPKKRSRAGCNYCKEKKKKCDEIRPQCVRCEERGQECVYEAVKPRQRRKREASAAFPLTPLDGNSSSSGSEQALQSPDATILNQQWRQERQGSDAPFDAESVIPDSEQNPLSGKPMNSPLDRLFTWSPRDLPILSPLDPVDFQFPNVDGTNFPTEDDDVEEIVRRDSFSLVNVTTQSTRSPSLALIAPVQLLSPRFEFTSPAFTEFSERTNRRALVDHFCNTLSHLIVFREECGNPFQQLVLPLCHNSSPVMNAVYALASAHLDYRGVKNGEKSVYFHNKSIQGLAKLIAQGGDANRNELLATIMLLVYYEVLVQKGRSNIVDGHLKGAMTIMGSSQAAADPTGVFLERAFRFYDVIAALSFGTAPLSTAPGASYLTPFPPLDSRGASSPLGSVDTLLGMATSLWPIIHRLSNLLILKDQLDAAISNGELSKVAVLRTEFEITASAIETALKEWQPILPPDSALTQNPEDLSADQFAERSRLQSILNNALAYRHSAFVYLYRTIYSYPRNHPLVQRHAHVSLTHCVGTVRNAGPMGALLWPLFIAACEAMSLADRDSARHAFVALDRRQGMMNIERAWTIAQEVWKRADKADLMQQEEQVTKLGFRRGGDLWRRVSEDMGVTIVFG